MSAVQDWPRDENGERWSAEKLCRAAARYKRIIEQLERDYDLSPEMKDCDTAT